MESTMSRSRAMSPGEAAVSRAMVYRRKAATCGRLAVYAREPGDRDRLVCMQEAWLALAANEDWLEGEAAPAAADRA